MTYKTAQDKIFAALVLRGWHHSAPDLIIRWARPPGALDQHNKLWLKPQALHKGQARPDTSLWIDVRLLARHDARTIELFLLPLLG